VTDSRVAKRYARALFAAAKKAGIVESVEADLGLVLHVARASGPFRAFLYSPTTSKDKKIEVLGKALSDRVTAMTMSFLRLVIDKGREDGLELIQHAFTELRRDDEGVIHADVTSSEPLDETQKRRLIEKLTRSSGKTIEPEYHVDPALIGGVKVALGNYVLDGTVEGSLARMRETLLFDVLKQN
jgi:F-type H+-transporting ATPase subunit delta